MNNSGIIPVRHFHAFRAKFTPRIQRKRIAPVMYPLSLKKLGAPVTVDGETGVTVR